MTRLLLALAAVAFFAAVSVAQMPGHQATPPAGQKKMTMDCEQMMAAHQKMMGEMKSMTARLDDLVQKMNAATGQAKVDATAAVVSEMVTQRKAMVERMENMHGMEMQHMGEHMMAGSPEGMAKCPMMQHPPK